MKFSTTVILILIFAFSLPLLDIPRVIPNVRASTTICKYDRPIVYTRNNDWSSRDVNIKVEIQTCGIINQDGTRFTATSQNITLYCWNAFTNTIQDGLCSDDFKVNSGNMTFSGLQNGQTVYQSVPQNSTSFRTWSFAGSISGTRSFSSTVDYAQDYWTLNFTDRLITSSRLREPECRQIGSTASSICVISGVQFIGTYNSFELDWADGNNDGRVNILDITMLSGVYGTNDTYWDFNRNGVVDSYDQNLQNQRFGQSWSVSSFPGQGEARKVLDNNPSWTALAPRHGGWGTPLQTPQGASLCGFMPQPDKAYCNALPPY